VPHLPSFLKPRRRRYRVMQIETSNLCSLTCVYCPHPTQARPKGNMSFETFAKCIALVERSDNPARNGRKFVWLNHFGEPLLNPLLPRLVAHATERKVAVSFSSNGVDADRQLFPRSLWRQLADAGLQAVCLSAHSRTADALREHVGDIVTVMDVWEPKPSQLHDWAGQVDMARFGLPVGAPPDEPCDYARHAMFAITWEGRIANCCYDIEGSARTVDDVLRDGFAFEPIGLCAGCTLGRGDLEMLSAHRGL
jgi:hypothetical protein